MKFLRELLTEGYHQFTWFDLETALTSDEEEDSDRYSHAEMWDDIGHAIEQKYPGTFDYDVLRYRHSSGPDLSSLAAEYVQNVYDKGGMEKVRDLLSDMQLLEHVTKSKKPNSS